jgi:hypothetical protein
MENLKKITDELGISIGNAFTTKKPEEFAAFVDKLNSSLQKQKDLVAGIDAITSGSNARAANISSQTDVNTVAATGVASFGLQLTQGVSAVAAISALQPTIDALRTAMSGTNYEMSAAGQNLMNLAAIIEANRVPFENLAADGQVLQGMMQGNIQDFDLFKTIASDIGVQLQGMIDKGVPTAQVLALAQPQLQQLWEAQQKWHVEVDGTTQSLIDQAVKQGLVGENMKSIQEQMLDATLGIKDALTAIAVQMGALPAVAAGAADGMNQAFNRVRAPDLGTARGSGGGGGTPSRSGGTGGSPGGTAIINLDGQTVARVVVPHIPGEVRRYGVG